LIIATVTLLAAGSAYADKEFTYDKKDNFDGAAVTSITIDMDRGDITIEKARGSNIEVLYKNAVFADNQSEADDINQDYRYSAKVEGGRLKVVVETPRHGRRGTGIVERIIEGDWSREGSYPMVKLAIPDGKSVEVLSASSDIDVSELVVDLDIESASSDITLENNQGKFSCDISSGDVGVAGHKGPITVQAKSSDIRIVDVEGSVDARTASGDVSIEKAKGTVEAFTASGDGRLSDIDGDVDVEAASGDITVSGVTGAVRANSVSGDVRLDGLSARDGIYEVESVSGDISIQVGDEFRGQLSARSVSGTVDSHFLDDIDTESESRVEGNIGQGTGRIEAMSTSGDITIDRY
jgi:DUF4097 and DUF4098 domain-containing protein YvlB